MAKYIVQHRRGTAKQWSESDTPMPKEGELVIEIDEENLLHKLKIGDGISEFSALPYMSVDSFILPKKATIHIDPSQWRPSEEGDGRHYQVVTVQNAVVTPNSKIDLQLPYDDLNIFYEKDSTFVDENWGGQVRIYCIGQTPQNSYDIPVTITEVIWDD